MRNDDSVMELIVFFSMIRIRIQNPGVRRQNRKDPQKQLKFFFWILDSKISNMVV
jgi:hypothetical protein